MIKNVVFDLGRVLFDFSHDRFYSFLREHGLQLGDASAFADAVGLIEFEHGELTSEGFLDRVSALFSAAGINPAERAAIRERWMDMFEPIPEMLALAKSLRERHKVLIISNTNELHLEFLAERFGLYELTDDIIASCSVGCMKPDRRIFEAAANKYHLVPSETVFIDDIEKNLGGAKELGWETIVHRSYAGTAAELRSLGVDV
jgi:glucose-1-phosphatase